MTRRLTVCVLGLALAAWAAAPASAQKSAPRAYVLDQEARTVVALDVTTGAVVRTATVQGSPSRLLRTADGKRLIALDRGAGRDAGEAGYQAKSRAVATVIDATTMEAGPRIELGWGLEPTAVLTPAGDRLTVICSGYVGRKPEETLPRELVTVDLATGQVSGRLPLPRPATAFFATPDGRTAVILSGRDKPKQKPALPAELRVVDLAATTLLATLPLDGNPQDPVLDPEGQFVYLLDPGNPSGNPEKNVNGRVFVISLPSRTLHATSDAGSRPSGLVLDERGRQLLLLSEAAPVKGAPDRGELRVLRGGAVRPPIALPPYPKAIRATADGARMLVVGAQGITTLTSPDLVQEATVAIRGIGIGEFAISPDGRRAFSTSNQNLWTYDVNSGKELGKVVTGRMSQRLLLAAVAGTATIASQSAGRREAEEKGRSYYMYTQYNLRDANERIAVRPDSKAVYALNDQTSDVTIIDAQTGNVIEKVGVSGSTIHFLPGAGAALVVGSSRVAAIDLASNTKLEDDLAKGSGSEIRNFGRTEVSPDGTRAVVVGLGAVLTVDGTSGRPTGMVQAFKRVADVIVAW